jgi:glycosyltransferase involved in cell wall biosynthesis
MKYEKGLCSICCLGYNHQRFLQECIETIWKQEYQKIEVIVVDDGSADDSVTLLKKLRDDSPVPMQIITQKNTGNIALNFNTALKHAVGEFVLFISLDDKLYPNSISEKLNMMNFDHRIAFAINSKITGIDDTSKVNDIVPPLTIDRMSNVTANDLLELDYREFSAYYIQGTVFRKEIVDAVGGFDEDMLGDDLILRTKINLYLKQNPDFSFEIIKSPSCYYRLHDNNIHKNSYRQIVIVAFYLERYWNDRKPPALLGNWMRHTIKKGSFKDGWKVFFVNKMTQKYLLHPQFWILMVKMAIRHGARSISNH